MPRVVITVYEKYNSNCREKLLLFSAFILFFSLIVVGFLLCCTEMEYSNNQQLARGYISKNVVFFELYDPSRLRIGNTKLTNRGVEITAINDSEGNRYMDLRPQAAEDPNYVISNDMLSNGLTKIETLLSSGGNDYMASIHNGELRGVFYCGEVTVPPIVEGRFFFSDECLSHKKYAVIGKDFIEFSFLKEGKKYIEYCGETYEVLGITGITKESSLDHVLFVNLGSMSNEEQLHGRIYIDGNSSMEAIFNEMDKNALSIFGVHINRLPTPKVVVDSVTSDVYIKPYLKVLLLLVFAFQYLSIVLQLLRINKTRIAIMSVCGISYISGLIKVSGRIMVVSLLGILFGGITDAVLIICRYFNLPNSMLYRVILSFLLIDLISIAIFELVIGIGMRKINVEEVIRAI